MTSRRKPANTALTERELTELPVELTERAFENERTENAIEISTRFLRERETRLDRQTLRLAQALIQAGFKVTDPRLAIIEEIVGFNREFEVNELIERLMRRSGAKPGVASVFRTVKLLGELGLLQRMHTGDGCHRYSLIRGHNHQVICRCCGRAVEFQGCDFSQLTEFLENQTGFKLEGHWMEFFGLCNECRTAAVETSGTAGLPVAPLVPHQHHPATDDERPVPLNVSAVSQNPS